MSILTATRHWSLRDTLDLALIATAHGISDALRDAELLARAILLGTDESIRTYETSRDAVSRGLMEVTDAIASLAWSMEEVKALHHRLSEEMKVGTRLIESWDPPGSVAA